MKRAALAPVYALALWVSVATAYLLALLGLAATRPPAAPARPRGRRLRWVVLIAAHDEEAGLPATLRALQRGDVAAETIVIADNCSDATAEVARAAGVTAWERVHDDRGKGQALAWALERLWRERPATEAVLLLDADCRPSANLLDVLEAELSGGAQAAQAIYDVGNPDASDRAALRWAGFALKHQVRPRGRAALGLSAGLFGTGMAFRAELLRTHPWRAFSIAEDIEYHLDLARAGVRVAFAEHARVSSAMPTTDARAYGQQLRWESGNARLAREHAAPLLRSGLRDRDLNQFLAGAELLLPPQTLLGPATLVCAGAALATRERPLAAAATFTALGQVVYVLAGLRLAGAPASVYRALASAPRLVAHKLGIFARIARGQGTHEWVRTDRDPVATPVGAGG